MLDKLIQRFRLSLAATENDKEKGGDKITLRVLNAIKMWVDKHFHDFDQILVSRLIMFLDEEVVKETKLRGFCKNLKKVFSMKLITNDAKSSLKLMFSTDPPESILPKNFKEGQPFKLMDWSPKEFARQLTLIEAKYFRRIQPKECLSNAWTKDKKYILAPNIAALTDRWNLVTRWVATTVMSQADLRQRRNYIVRFIEIAAVMNEIIVLILMNL